MSKSQFTNRFLALHYVFPVPLNKLFPLLEYDPELVELEKIPPHFLAKLCNISLERAIKLQKMFQEFVEIPIRQMYENYSIAPILFSHPNYPKILLNLYYPPAVIYLKGKLELLSNS